MNLFGEGFPKEINEQVKTRQKIHGLGYDNPRTPESHLYKNANSAWCKLVSSTYITKPEFLVNTNIKNIGYSGDDLARDFILFNGTSKQNDPNNRAGIGFGGNSHAYTSWGKVDFGSADYGFRPMAGITGVSVKHKNRGTIRAATINIKAWDKISFEIIDVLYLRLGFSVLLEWGNSMYYDNNGTFINNPNNSLANEFLAGKVTYYDFLNLIKAQQLKSFGNYDAMFGKVTNIHWSYQPDGSYDIALDLISGGDIIESFKIKGKALSSPITPTTPISTIIQNNPVVYNAKTADSGYNDYKKNLDKLTKGLNSTTTSTQTTPNTQNISILDNPDINKVLQAYAKSSDIAFYLNAKSIELQNSGFSPPGVNTIYQSNGSATPYVLTGLNGGEVVRVFPLVTSGTPANISDYFIRLGDFLYFIQEKILYKIKNNGGEIPFLKIDTDTETNLIHAPEQLLSYDPRVCMVRRDVTFPPGVGTYNPNVQTIQQTFNKITNPLQQPSVTIPLRNTTPTPAINDVFQIVNQLQAQDQYNNNTFLQKTFNQLQAKNRSSKSQIDQTLNQFQSQNTPPLQPNNTTNVITPLLTNVTSSNEYFAHPYGDVDYEDTNYINKFMVDGTKLEDVGKIMNIYVNFRFIITKLQELSDTDTNTVTLYNFLKDLVSNINSAFGGYTKLDLWIDEESNTLKIIDQNPLPSNKAALTYVGSINQELALFELTGYAYRSINDYYSAGFIKEFKFNTELTPDFATMITVSATNQGNVVGENNTALSLLNRGLKDRFKEEINGGGALTKTTNTNTSQETYDNYVTAEKEYSDFLNELNDYLDHLYNNVYLPEEIEDHKSTYTVFLQIYKKYANAKTAYEKSINTNTDPLNINNKFQPGTGFIPFNLSLTMDGLSGMKIGSKFEIDASYLPSNYPDTVDFLIKAINHDIKDNRWTTTLESYCIAQGDDSNKTKTKTKGSRSRISAPSGPSISGTWTTVVGKLQTLYAGEKYNNIKILVNEMISQGITNPYAQIGILCTIGKESNYIPKFETGYSNTGNDRLRTLFGSRISQFNDAELEVLKKDDIKFFDYIYGYKVNPSKPGWSQNGKWDTKNSQPGDGWKYRGGGFNQITFKSGYEKYGKIVGLDLVTNPDLLNDVNTAAKAAVTFMVKGLKNKNIDQSSFTDADSAIRIFVAINHGGNFTDRGYSKASTYSGNFRVQ
jgi:predicted chitinase